MRLSGLGAPKPAAAFGQAQDVNVWLTFIGLQPAAGEHLPHVANAAVHRQLAAVFGAHNLGHTVVTVASDDVRPAAGGNSEAQVLVSRDDTPVAGYDAVTLDDTNAIADYFARIAS